MNSHTVHKLPVLEVAIVVIVVVFVLIAAPIVEVTTALICERRNLQKLIKCKIEKMFWHRSIQPEHAISNSQQSARLGSSVTVASCGDWAKVQVGSTKKLSAVFPKYAHDGNCG